MNEIIAKTKKEALGFFVRAFRALTRGRSPFPWQRRAFLQLAQGDIPGSVGLPTGTGKTSLISIWLIALAWQATRNQVSLPRRLVWVVNRRVVVDQATEEATGLVSRLRSAKRDAKEHQEILHRLRSALANLSCLGSRGIDPIAVSTLRGQLADNGEWKLDPSRPAIVVGTVDMVGSRLLFSGYGDGRSKRALHAGLLGQDALVVLDEAHLTPPFGELLHAIQEQQRASGHPRPLRVALLSATQREPDSPQALGIEDDDRSDPVIGPRLTAKKMLHIHRLGESDMLAAKLSALALAHRDACARVVVYVRSPKTAEEVRKRIEKEARDCEIRVLTGTLRGFERDLLARDPVFAGFRSDPDRHAPDVTHYLISTSAGEVGADLDADHLLCDLTPIDSLIQRFGRVNRLGLGNARVDMVVPADEEIAESCEKAALAYLEKLPKVKGGRRNLSPHALSAYPPPIEAFSPKPPVVPLARHWLDMWALTSIRETNWPDRPEVAPWLHGVEAEAPETWVAWREDVVWLSREEVREEDCRDALDACPVLTHERLRAPSRDIRERLAMLAEIEGTAAQRVLLIKPDSNLWRGTLGELARLNAQRFRFATILLPPEAGGLSKEGLFTPDCAEPALDLAEVAAGMARRRFLVEYEPGGWAAYPLRRHPDDAPIVQLEDRNALADALARKTGLKLLESVQVGGHDESEEETNAAWILYFSTPASAVESATISFVGREAVALPAHSAQVAKIARDLVEKNGLADLALAFEWAGGGHDRGKNRRCWQRAIGNRDADRPLAKSGNGRFSHTMNDGYRHEFGSLLDATADPSLQGQRFRDLVLHLIASHHGHARPHFSEHAFDRETALEANSKGALEAIQRFAHLQASYGWWGLAWLEALFKAADGIASAGLDEGDKA